MKVMRMSERCFEDMAMRALEEEILGVAAGGNGVVKAHGKSFQRGCGGVFVADGQTA